MIAALVLCALSQQSAANIQADLQTRWNGSVQEARAMFSRPADAEELLHMVAERVGQDNRSSVQVDVIKAPPGWEVKGKYWAVFSVLQDLEEYHDMIYPITSSGLGPEIRDEVDPPARIATASIDTHLRPQSATISVKADLKLTSSANKAAIFRLNLPYQVDAITGADRILPASESASAKDGDWVRAGSLLIHWSTTLPKELTFNYHARLTSRTEDRVRPDHAIVAAWWVPSLGRLPFTTKVRTTAPASWLIRSEGTPIEASAFGPVPRVSEDEHIVAYQCDVPISYPKVVAGEYEVISEGSDSGRTFKYYRLKGAAPDDAAKQRADSTVAKMIKAAADYSQGLAKWPFPGYECFESDDYYGIESYSYTVLQKSICERYVAHEMGHTYFGGLGSCPYVVDSWNEGLTTFIDDVFYHHTTDGVTNLALRGLNIQAPISAMPAAHDFRGASYWRGAYVIRVLANEIGAGAVMAGLQDIVKLRDPSPAQTWASLQGVFERASGKDLSVFWKENVFATTFPRLEITSMNVLEDNGKSRTTLVIRQSGTDRPNHLRFAVILSDGQNQSQQVLTLNDTQATFNLDSSFSPSSALLNVKDYALATVGPIAKPQN